MFCGSNRSSARALSLYCVSISRCDDWDKMGVSEKEAFCGPLSLGRPSCCRAQHRLADGPDQAQNRPKFWESETRGWGRSPSLISGHPPLLSPLKGPSILMSQLAGFRGRVAANHIKNRARTAIFAKKWCNFDRKWPSIAQ